MAPSSLQLWLLYFAAPLLLAPRSPWASADPFVLIDAASFNAVDEAMSNAEAAKVSSSFIAAESRASATSAVSAADPGEMEAWDFSDTDSESEEATEAAGTEVQESVIAPDVSPEGEVVTASLDAILDFALQAFAYEIAKNKSSETPVPDFNKDFHSRVGPFKVHGHFAASRGTVGDLTSLFRDGHVEVRSEPQGKLVLDGAVGLRLLRVRFQHYSARAGPIRVSGTMEAQVSPATVRAQLELSLPCSVALRSLAVARVGPLSLRLTGLGALKRLLPLIRRWVEKRVREDVERLAVQRLSQLIRNELSKISCH